uniref:Uncharacterized protein n=1 Tax=Oryza rufipogon TaxID=4529 RepID=A0A0E0R9Z0_ORYRU
MFKVNAKSCLAGHPAPRPLQRRWRRRNACAGMEHAHGEDTRAPRHAVSSRLSLLLPSPVWMRRRRRRRAPQDKTGPPHYWWALTGQPDQIPPPPLPSLLEADGYLYPRLFLHSSPRLASPEPQAPNLNRTGDRSSLHPHPAAAGKRVALCCDVQIFNGKQLSNPMYVIFMSSYWLHFWSTMLPQEEQDTMHNGVTLLELVANGLLFHYGWRSSIRIAS